jgi:phage tail sheath protein FI
MPVIPAHSYPGVYIQEVPSGVHTITGVATSITAFIGVALRGPVNQPITITSYADFDRTFGGLWSDSSLGYAINDFYTNGGSQAVIVRLFPAPKQATPPTPPPTQVTAVQNTPASPTPPAVIPPLTNALLNVGALALEARDPGMWGNYLTASIDPPGVRDDNDAEERYGLAKADLFTLTIKDLKAGTTEIFRNVSVRPGAQRIDQILAINSRLVSLSGALPDKVTIPSTSTVEGANKVANDIATLTATDFLGGEGDTFQADKRGLYALENVDLFNLLCIPPYSNGDVEPGVVSTAATYCEARRAMLLVDPPGKWTTKQSVLDAMADPVASLGTASKNAMLFFSRIKRFGSANAFASSGAIAGVIARTDSQRGVWKAPAGLDATLAGVSQLAVPLTDLENGELNKLGVNCLRTMPGVGPVVWGARTLQGNDDLASEWKYIPVRRLTLYIEESLYRGTRWAVFEPNDEPLWSQIRLNLGAFMHDLFRQGAFQGKTPQGAYFVQCDSTTTNRY